MRQWRFVAAALGFVLATVWAGNALGPSVDCGEFDAAACEEIWRSAATRLRDTTGIPADVQPVTVRLEGPCPSYIYITWSDGRQSALEGLC